MKVYAEILPPTLGRVVKRINLNIRKYAPSNVEFVTDPDKADLQILDVIGLGSLPFLKCKKYVMFPHNFWCMERSDPEFWLPIFKNAELIATYVDIPTKIHSTDFNFIRTGWGTDPSIFYDLNRPLSRTYTALTTGYVTETECIREPYKAIEFLGKKMVHIGGKFNLGPRCLEVENISDDLMRDYYNSSKYVCGMRRLEGFEFPVMEGTLCGARPICLDQEDYHYFFGDIPIFLREDPSPDGKTVNQSTINKLIEIFKEDPRPISDAEKEYIKDSFSWEKNIKAIWKGILHEQS